MPSLTIRLSTAACGYAVGGRLNSTDAGAEMHVAITRGIRSRSGKIRSISAPVEAWYAFLLWLEPNALTAPGASHSEQVRAACLMRARDRIAAEFDRLAKHPAYRGVAVRGVDTTEFPAYRCGDGRWWPSPDMALAASDGSTLRVTATTLKPHRVMSNSQQFTSWCSAP